MRIPLLPRAVSTLSALALAAGLLAVPAAATAELEPEEPSASTAPSAELPAEEPADAQDAALLRGVSTPHQQVQSIVSLQPPATVASSPRQVFVVPVSPGGEAYSSPTGEQADAEAIAEAVAVLDGYWSRQSSGKVRFSLAGIGDWYQSEYVNCIHPQFNEQVMSAARDLGYAGLSSQYLVVLLPEGVSCSAVGGVDITYFPGVNSGGRLYLDRLNDAEGRAGLIRGVAEILGIGQGKRVECDEGQFPDPYDGCGTVAGPDPLDVRGEVFPGSSPAALSSAQAINAGIWPASAYKVVSAGTSVHTLRPVGSSTGLRGLVAFDEFGWYWFVEYRAATGDDATVLGQECPAAPTCIAPKAGVRLLRFPAWGHNAWLGILNSAHGEPQAESAVIAFEREGVPSTAMIAGESVQTDPSGSTPLKVEVLDLGGGSAKVRITRPKLELQVPDLGGMTIYETSSPAPYSGDLLPGSELTVYHWSSWIAESISYQWYRVAGTGSKKKFTVIKGATKRSYTLTSADVGQRLTVKATGHISGKKSRSVYYDASSDEGSGGKTVEPIGPVVRGTIDPHAVQVLPNGKSLKASAVGWSPSGLGYSYQWYRGATPIKKATKATYTPTSIDRGQELSVLVRASRSGYTTSAWVASAEKDYAITAAGSAVIENTAPEVGETLTVTALEYATVDGPISPATPSYQWLRDGKKIKGATSAGYAVSAADYKKTISVSVSQSLPGYITHSVTAPRTAKVALGTIAGTHAVPLVAKAASPGRTLTAVLPEGSVTEPGVKITWQWLRDGKAIPKAVKTTSSPAVAVTYTPVDADYGKLVTARATVTKSRYATVLLVSEAPSAGASRDSLLLSWSRELEGTLGVGWPLGIAERVYTADGEVLDPAEYTETVQWYRSGKAIPVAQGGTAYAYTPGPPDIGKTLSVKVSFRKPGYLGSSWTSIATPKVGAAVMDGAVDLPAGTLTAEFGAPTEVRLTFPAPGSDGSSDLIATRKYQWYRDGTAIKKATKQSYLLTPADAGKLIHGRVSITKSGFSEVIRLTEARNYSVTADGAPAITGTVEVGQSLEVALPGYATLETDTMVSITPGEDGSSIEYQWYRGGSAISTADGGRLSVYLLTQKDKGKQLTVKVTVKKPGYLDSTRTSQKTAKVAAAS